MSRSTANLTLYRGWLSPNQYVWSPFVTKPEARLRFAGIPYETKAGWVRSAPRGKIPYIDISQAGETTQIGDSSLIIKDLVDRGILPDINGELDAEGRARDLALRALMEEKLNFYHGPGRWVQNYYAMRDHALGAIPYPVRVVVGLLVYRSMVQTLHGQGTGRYTDDEIRCFRRETWQGINDLLASARKDEGGKKPFWILGGDGPSEADATVFGFAVSVLVCEAGPESKELVRGFPVILDYVQRIQGVYFEDYESVV